jgi:hypothetical protein
MISTIHKYPMTSCLKKNENIVRQTFERKFDISLKNKVASSLPNDVVVVKIPCNLT